MSDWSSALSAFHISEPRLALAIGVGLFLYFALRLGRGYIRSLKISYIKRIFPLSEIILWFLYALWTLRLVLVNVLYYNIFLLTVGGVVMFWLAWFVIRDLIAGVVLKLQEPNILNSRIIVNDVNGIVKNIGFLSLDLEQDDGTVLLVPFSKITGQIHYKTHNAPQSPSRMFEVALPADLGIELAEKHIHEIIMLSPYAALTYEPVIRFARDDGKWLYFNLAARAIDASDYPQLENDIREKLNNTDKKK